MTPDAIPWWHVALALGAAVALAFGALAAAMWLSREEW